MNIYIVSTIEEHNLIKKSMWPDPKGIKHLLSSTEPLFVPVRFHLGNLLPPIHGDVTCHSKNFKCCQVFCELRCLEVQVPGGHQEEEQMPEKKKRVEPALSTCFCQTFFCKRLLLSQSANTLHELFVNHHAQDSCVIQFPEGKWFGNALKNRFSTRDLAELPCPCCNFNSTHAHYVQVWSYLNRFIDK